MPPKPPALRPRGDGVTPDSPGTAMPEVRRLPLELIDPNPEQPRRLFRDIMELAADIAERGVLQPILVRPHPQAPDRFLIVAGERRYRASIAADMGDIPAIIRTYEDEAAAAADTAVENLQRADLTYGEEAAQYQALMQAWGLRHATELAERLHRPVRRIQRVLQVADHPALAALVDEGALTLMQALDQLKRPTSAPVPTLSSAYPTAEHQGDVFPTRPAAPLYIAEGSPPTIAAGNGQDTAHSGEEGRIAKARGEKRQGDVFPLAGQPLSAFCAWLERTPPSDVPPDARATVQAQLAALRAQVEAWEQAWTEQG